MTAEPVVPISALEHHLYCPVDEPSSTSIASGSTTSTPFEGVRVTAGSILSRIAANGSARCSGTFHCGQSSSG